MPILILPPSSTSTRPGILRLPILYHLPPLPDLLNCLDLTLHPLSTSTHSHFLPFSPSLIFLLVRFLPKLPHPPIIITSEPIQRLCLHNLAMLKPPPISSHLSHLLPLPNPRHINPPPLLPLIKPPTPETSRQPRPILRSYHF